MKRITRSFEPLNKAMGPEFWLMIRPFISIVLLIMMLPSMWILIKISLDTPTEDRVPIGDTIGGIMGPFVALLAAFLTFMAFYIQKLANDQVKNQFVMQSIETAFTEMCKIHRENVEGFELRSADRTVFWRGRRCFTYMIEELRWVFKVVDYVCHKENISLDKMFVSDLSYRLFFFGVDNIKPNEGPEKLWSLSSPKTNARKALNANEERIVQVVIHELQSIQRAYDAQLQRKKADLYGALLLNLHSHIPREEFKEVYLYYYPFSGHVVRLSHTYRQLYMTVCFIAENQKLIGGDKEQLETKKRFLRILRSQLNSDEQLLLYYNGLCFGKSWFDKGLFTEFKMIHNIVLPQANFGLHPKDHQILKDWIKYHPDEILFEWDENILPSEK